MHKDISIGNVLMTEKPVMGKAFTVSQRFVDDLPLLEDTSLGSDILGLCTNVQQLVGKLGISDECIGFVTDGDLAKPWRDYIAEGHQETESVSRYQVVSPPRLTRFTGHT